MEISCPLCKGSDFAPWRFGLLCCKKCGLVVDEAVWRPSANEQMEERFFGEAYEPTRSFWVRLFERWNNRRTMRRLRRHIGSKGALLEVGIGSGSFLVHARHCGFTPIGCDLSAAICLKVQRATGIRTHCGPLSSLSHQDGFDVIVMNHVLEHVADPQGLLAAAFAHLKPGGLLHLVVPNVICWEARLKGWNSYEPYHLLYFSPLTLQAVVEKAGFRVVSVSTHESFSGWSLALLRSALDSPRSVKPQAGASGRLVPIWLHGYRLTLIVCGLITLPLRRFQEWVGRGDEVILLAARGAAENANA